jgi:GNAT superfamily N-acetyltransferase
MSVDREYRRRGIATGILDHLIQLAKGSGIASLVLETNEPWGEVVRFYLEYGFNTTAQGGGNVHLALDLMPG